MRESAAINPSRRPVEQDRGLRSDPSECGTWKAFRVLEDFCRLSGFEPLRVRRLRPEDLPQPYRTLLAHSKDMTSTLEDFYGEKTGLKVLRREHSYMNYSREVLLTTPRQDAVEYGIIRIDLAYFPEVVRARILGEQLPLGRLLLEHQVAHLCWPQGFFEVDPHGYLQGVMRLEEPAVCYGRRNVIVSGEHQLLADVLEILAPCDKNALSNPS